jgi:sortase (surface protein transpeptidase)
VALLAITVLTGWRMTRGVEEFGMPPTSSGVAPSLSEPVPDPTFRIGPGASTETRGPPLVPVQPGGPPAVSTVAPVRLSIPAVRLNAPVKPVGIDPDTRELAVPEARSTVGWYRYGPGMDADSGSLVIAGHVDSLTQGPGPFFRLAEVGAGARISVRATDGSVRGFRVVSREVFRKSKAPYDRLFARDGPFRLTLVTCGGGFDRKTGSYRDNVVVTAVPVG